VGKKKKKRGEKIEEKAPRRHQWGGIEIFEFGMFESVKKDAGGPMAQKTKVGGKVGAGG